MNRFSFLVVILVASLVISDTYVSDGQNLRLKALANYRITPIYLSSSREMTSTPGYIPFQDQDSHLSGLSGSFKFEYDVKKDSDFFLILESGFRFDHLYYENIPGNVNVAGYYESVNTWILDISFGIGKNFPLRSSPEVDKSIGCELKYGLFNRNTGYERLTNAGKRSSDDYRYNPLIFTFNYVFQRMNIGISCILMPDREVFDMNDQPFILPQLSVGYTIF